MRHGRAKQARKTLQFFERTVGVKPPYHVVLDGTFVVAVCKYKVPLQERLEKLLHCHHQNQHAHNSGIHGGNNNAQSMMIHLYVCSSTIAELQALLEQSVSAANNAEHADIFREAIQWCSVHCQEVHQTDDKTAAAEASSNKKRINSRDTCAPATLSVAAADVLKLVTTSAAVNSSSNSSSSATGTAIATTATNASHTTTSATEESNITTTNSHHPNGNRRRCYFCASQDEELLDRLRHNVATAAVPIIRLARGSVLLLEQPSKFAARSDVQNERHKWRAGVTNESERKLVDLVKTQQRQRQQQQQQKQKQKQPADSRAATRKPKKAKGPNPLSCKKRSTATASDSAAAAAAVAGNNNKRRRKSSGSSGTTA